MKLKNKLLFSFMSVGLIPAAVIALVSLVIASQSLEQTAYNKLSSIMSSKKAQITQYFRARQRDLIYLTKTVEKIVDFTDKQTITDTSHASHAYFKEFIKTYGYSDLFLISGDGEVVYSVVQGADYQTNLNTGRFSQSGLAQLYKTVINRRQPHMSDFSPYSPSQGEPASFIAMPIISDNVIRGVLAMRLSNNAINNLMQERKGLGDSGDTYLVGEDFLMRSDSYQDPANRSVKASFAGTVQQNGVKTEAVTAGLRGESDTRLILSHQQQPVLAAFTQILFSDYKWVLVAEIDESEALKPVKELKFYIVILLVLTVAAVISVTYVIAKSILKPLGGEPNQMKKVAEKIAEGDLTVRFTEQSDNSGVYGAMKTMSEKLQISIEKITHVVSSLAATAEQSSSTSKQANVSLHEQQVNIEQVAMSMREMTVNTQDVASNAREVADSTNQIVELSYEVNKHVSKTQDVMQKLTSDVADATGVIKEMEVNSQNIGSVLEVIRGIADQTNLLALNAAIEAARAGEQGRGFAVVADEVRQLAQKTQQSTTDIEQMIDILQKGSENAVNVMEYSSSYVGNSVSAMQCTADAIEEVTEQIGQIAKNADKIAVAADQQSNVSEEINQSLHSIGEAAYQNSKGADQISGASQQLNELASQLQQVTGNFKVNN